MGVVEKHTRFREAIEVGRNRLRMPTHRLDPVVEIVQGYEQHVWPIRSVHEDGGYEKEAKKQFHNGR